MRIARFLTPAGSPTVGVVGPDTAIDVSSSLEAEDPDLAFLRLEPDERQQLVDNTPEERRFPASEVRILAPVAHPGKVLAIARGYRRAQESAVSDDATPYVFLKRTDDLLGPSDPIVIGPPATAVVAEIEIGLVIGRRAKDVPVESAPDFVAGFTIGNDVSARGIDLPPPGRRDPKLDGFLDWLNGKWLDGFLALGPEIVTTEEWSDNGARRIETRISGARTVAGNTADLLHGFDEVVAFASRLMTLQTGDVILTGMPETPKPERWLSPGDLVEGKVEGLGILRNPVVAAGADRPRDAVS